VEALDPHPADALPQALNASDALACAHQDAAVDAVHPELRPPSADDAEKWVDRARDARVRDGTFRRLELQAAPSAGLAVPAPCTLAVARFGERSCAAPGAAEQPDAPKQEPLAERPPKPPEALQRLEPAPRAVLWAVPGVR